MLPFDAPPRCQCGAWLMTDIRGHAYDSHCAKCLESIRFAADYDGDMRLMHLMEGSEKCKQVEDYLAKYPVPKWVSRRAF